MLTNWWGKIQNASTVSFVFQRVLFALQLGEEGSVFGLLFLRIVEDCGHLFEYPLVLLIIKSIGHLNAYEI
jgi:hypothetical protein